MQSIGERLEEARKRKGISIREAAEATKIRGDYLHKFESNQFDIKLPEIYVRGFLRTYANYLKIAGDKIISDYNGLGLGEARNSRGINREVYGRIDLSVSSAKVEKEAKEPVGSVETPAPAEPAAPRNPATFVPKSTTGPSIAIDQALLIKICAGVAGLIILLVLIFAFAGRGERATANANAPAPVSTNSGEIWVRPQANEPFITLVAIDRVTVTVQNDASHLIFQGTLARGDRRDIPRTGKLQINSDLPEHLRVNIGGTEWPLTDPHGAYLKSAVIMMPK